ncbi:DUF4270 family protein [Puia dinghuensis]|uniref:DUF4270 family protein n=1 Tax=Puia dinghuensis TaxID=1792502 RepID=A0A8J2UAG8_9BACT|nr:DUF4270 family protein [Puia dinghuensis]GGA89614.1 hypothetical protein GCM10011511_11050 [Puia dinghuensis]
MTIHKYLRKELLFLLSSSLLALFLLSGCQKQPDLLFGNQYTNLNSGANIVLVDTSSVIVSTVLVDSAATASTGYLMVGNYNDAYLGKVMTRSYLQVAPPSSTGLPSLDPRIDTYDSIGLVLFAKTGNPYYGDTTLFQKYAVSQVDTLWQLAPNQNGWYSNDSLPLGPQLGSTVVRIFPNLTTSNGYSSNTSQFTGDTVRIRMNQNLGQQIYNMVYNKSDTIINNAKWLRWFHGLCLFPDSNVNFIYGFKDSAVMRVYYRENGVTSTEKSIDFNITDKSFQFNNIQTAYNSKQTTLTGKPIDNLIKPTQNPQVPPATVSTKVGNAGYVQTIGGLNVKLTFPYLNAIALRPDYLSTLRAILTVRPIPGSFSTIWRLPPQVGIYYTDQTNLLGIPLSASGVAGSQTGNLVLDYFHPLNTVYTYDVTNFVKAYLLNPNPTTASQIGLMLSVPAPNNVSAFNRLIIADQSYPVDQRITLNVYYISLYNHQ